jgi:hypothetical protein
MISKSFPLKALKYLVYDAYTGTEKEGKKRNCMEH